MSNAGELRSQSSTWWEALGLQLIPSRSHDATESVLRSVNPIEFASVGSDTEAALSLEQVTARIEAETPEAALCEQRAAAQRRAAHLAEFESAFTRADAQAEVTHGRWAGFTRGEAAAWCWNLFQYEPHGFVHPGSEVRARALAELRAGGVPEVFGYPERARELVNRGVTPREYRRHRKALGSPMFDPHDIRRG